MTFIFAAVGLLLGMVGVLVSPRATQGAALVGFGCLLVVCARLIQARAHQSQARQAWKTATPEPPREGPEPLPMPVLDVLRPREPGF